MTAIEMFEALGYAKYLTLTDIIEYRNEKEEGLKSNKEKDGSK